MKKHPVVGTSAELVGKGVTLGGGDRSPIQFAFWNVRRDIVIDNVMRYAEQAGETIECLTVDGDYEAILSAGFAAGKGLDLLYAQRAEASLWHDRGYIAGIDEADPALRPTLARMDQRMVAGARHPTGQLIGLTYYNGGPFALFLHEAFAGQVKAERLTSLEALLDECRRLKKDGTCPHPFVPRWHSSQTGLVWSLLCHLAAEGVLDLAAPQAESALAGVLRFMRSLVDDNLVPPASLDDGSDTPALLRWVGGGHALSFTTDYLAMDAREQAGRPVSIVAPRIPGATGTPLMPGHALLCMKSGLPPERAERVLHLMAFLGGLDPGGIPRVHARWLSEALFAVPFPELSGEPEIRSRMRMAFPPAHAEASLERMIAGRARAVVSPATHAPWFLDWSGFCDRLVRDGVLRTGRLSPVAAAQRLLDHWGELQAVAESG